MKLLMRFFLLIMKSSRRNRRRTALTILSVSVSMGLLGVTIAMYDAFYLSEPSGNEALRLVTRNKISVTQSIPLSYQDRIRKIPGVREVMVSNWFGGIYKDSRDIRNSFARFAIIPDTLFTIYGELRIPEDEQLAFQRDRTGCVIGRDLADSLHFHVGDRIPLIGSVFPGNYEFTIRGIFDSPRASDVMYFAREYLEQSMPERRRGLAGMFLVLVNSPHDTGRVAQAIDDEFRNSTLQTKTESEQAFTVSFLSLLGNIKVFLIAIIAAVMFSILLVSANTISMSARERVREVGVLKTLGFTRSLVFELILGEACFISIVGSTIGYLISAALLHIAAKGPLGWYLPPLPFIDLRVAMVCTAAAAIIGIASSLVPALTASRISIVMALHSTD